MKSQSSSKPWRGHPPRVEHLRWNSPLRAAVLLDFWSRERLPLRFAFTSKALLVLRPIEDAVANQKNRLALAVIVGATLIITMRLNGAWPSMKPV